MGPSLRRACTLLIAVTGLAGAVASGAGLESTAHHDAAGRLQLDVHFDCTIAAPVSALTAAGFAVSTSAKAGSMCIIEGWAQLTALPRIRAVAGVTAISAPSYVQQRLPQAQRAVLHNLARSAGQKQGTAVTGIDGNGIAIMRADQFVAQTGTNGAGVTVGVQSVGVSSLATIQGRGELPASVQVVFPAGNSTPVVGDEGTALLEQVHAVAPGANLVFCGPSTFVDFASCLTQLINAGATIVLDDTTFVADDLLSQDNDQSSAVAQILAQHPDVLLLSAAGNNEGSYWQGSYSPISAGTTALPPLSCSGVGNPDAYVAAFGAGTSQTLTVKSYSTFPLLLAWADPPGQITSQFDVSWYGPGSIYPIGCFSTAGSTTNESVQYVTLAPGTYTLVVSSPDATAAGKFLKLWAGGDGLTALSTSTPGSLVTPQSMVPGVLTVGAVNGSDGLGNSIEDFSSTGPLTFAFPAMVQLQAPTITAPDGIVVDAAGTYFSSYLFPDGNFYGTSASVPNAGAVAALLRGAFPTLSVAQVSAALQTGATPLGATVPDPAFGYGRVDAMGALATVPVPTITALVDQSSSGSASTAAQPVTVTGIGALHFTLSSSNPALVPNSVVGAGMPGLTVSSGCGTSTLTCTLAVTPIIGQAGTATLTISVVDGANRSAAAQMTLTATDPAPAPTGSGSGDGTGSTGAGSGTGGGSGATTSTPSSGDGGGGSLPGWALLCLGALLARSQRRALRTGTLA